MSLPQVIKLACFVMKHIMFALWKEADQNQLVQGGQLSLQLVLPAEVIIALSGLHLKTCALGGGKSITTACNIKLVTAVIAALS